VTGALAPARPALLALEDISLSFRAVKAISRLSVEVMPHEICALIGPNGAGKSSLLNVISGLYPPDSGAVVFAGQRFPRMFPRQAAVLGIARTFQNIALFKGMSVIDNVIAGRNLKRRSTWIEQALGVGRAPREDAAQRLAAERIIQFLRLHRHRDTTVGTLPYGVQKQVELARALAAAPTLLLLDEPMAGLNAHEKAAMSGYILDVNRELGTTIVLIEHDMNVVMDVSDHVVVLDGGRKLAQGTPDQVRANPDVVRAYLGGRHTDRASRGNAAPARVAQAAP
jgi:branched-chain amino acid transport system ATP-binding protein